MVLEIGKVIIGIEHYLKAEVDLVKVQKKLKSVANFKLTLSTRRAGHKVGIKSYTMIIIEYNRQIR